MKLVPKEDTACLFCGSHHLRCHWYPQGYKSLVREAQGTGATTRTSVYFYLSLPRLLKTILCLSGQLVSFVPDTRVTGREGELGKLQRPYWSTMLGCPFSSTLPLRIKPSSEKEPFSVLTPYSSSLRTQTSFPAYPLQSERSFFISHGVLRGYDPEKTGRKGSGSHSNLNCLKGKVS